MWNILVYLFMRTNAVALELGMCYIHVPATMLSMKRLYMEQFVDMIFQFRC